jgi:hypothetical protein
MKIKLFTVFVLILAIFFFGSCITTPEEPEDKQLPPVDSTPPVEEPEPEEEFVISEELYTETFEDIKTVIGRLNEIIASKNFNEWTSYLTDEYIEYYSNPEVLNEYTEQYKQRGYNYRIDSLEDYFRYLVVISRANAVLDEIIFTDGKNVRAMTKQRGKLSVLYYLKKTEDGWKIGLKPEN